MNTWQEFAALGYWTRIEVSRIKTEADHSDLRWALDKVLPRETTKVGFRDREITPQELPALLKHIDRGEYEKALREVRKELAPDVRLGSVKKELKEREAERLAKRYNAKGTLSKMLNAETAWRLEQLGHAYLVLQDLEALGDDMSSPSDDWLLQAVEVAKHVLKDHGLLWPDTFGNTNPDYASFEHIFVKRTQKKKSSVPNESEVTWEVQYLPPLEEVLPSQNEERDEPVIGSIVDPAEQKKRAETIRRLESEGWFPLSDLADNNHTLFEIALGHAVSIIRLADEARTLLHLVEHSDPYSPSTETVKQHMFELSAVSFEMGRHVQALGTTEFVYFSRRFEKQRHDLSAKNRNPKGSMNPDTRKVLNYMKNYMSKQIRNGKKKNISAAARAAAKRGLGKSEKANRILYYDTKKEDRK